MSYKCKSVDQSSCLFPGEIGGFQREETHDVIRDIDWSTRNVMLGYDVAGNKHIFFFLSHSFFFSINISVLLVLTS